MNVPVIVLGSTLRRHGYRWLHSTVDVLDILEISSVVSTEESVLHVSYGCKVG
ncbi:uncharacterized protein DS421_1g27880 [Arachis hypogaea]|nr:uncharacterized protein DS421_1g27880 [Arachis hypogaea]